MLRLLPSPVDPLFPLRRKRHCPTKHQEAVLKALVVGLVL